MQADATVFYVPENALPLFYPIGMKGKPMPPYDLLREDFKEIFLHHISQENRYKAGFPAIDKAYSNLADEYATAQSSGSAKSMIETLNKIRTLFGDPSLN